MMKLFYLFSLFASSSAMLSAVVDDVSDVKVAAEVETGLITSGVLAIRFSKLLF